ncbi:Glutathione hydrolase-like YwrD proenzyme [Erysiphe necator]|uniref:Putative gamma-glutamyltranspeptidase family protein n=1 Tax=Uncinula necator TaxID=52586 RepID=A0A0B1PDY8_UNCNE|nr:Glutathione hydrolase-like YwrD proenzyme [Erysiphe necator]KHJ35570.1 putative gamma-glutamyltranspeptidase family protein [Erysiphe necator]
MPLRAKEKFQRFNSRRSVVHSTEGMIACTQPLAARCGLKILEAGGNAADVGVAVAAGMSLTEPTSTGLGGDMFCLFYNSKTKKIQGLNGSGRASKKSSLEAIRGDLGLQDGVEGKIPTDSIHAVTVPGAAAGWVDTIEKFGSGKLSLEQILAPAIELAERGFPVSEISSHMWSNGTRILYKASPNYAELLTLDQVNNTLRAPRSGEIFRNPHLAKTLRLLAVNGKKGFYKGQIAKEIIRATKDRGGFLELEDLELHMKTGSEIISPLSYIFRGQGYVQEYKKFIDKPSSNVNEEKCGVKIWECPPNGQGIVALQALALIEILEEKGKIPKFTKEQHNSVEYLHALIECLRISFADASWWVADPLQSKIPISKLLSREYLVERSELFDPNKASKKILDHGSPAHNHSDTIYFSVTDKEGNAISFINSNFGGFGSGIIPKNSGFVLQNRGSNFSLTPNHPNAIGPCKRPYHTIIPSMLTNAHDESLHSVFGVMGGFMQPQGHVQVFMNMIVFKYDPQTALDAPRFCIGAENIPSDTMGRKVKLEEGISETVCEGLRAMGHDAEIVRGFDRRIFGRGQVIRSNLENNLSVFSGGSDLRGDGAVFPG